MSQTIVVTGGNGGLGRFVIDELHAHGYRVVNVDRDRDPDVPARTIVADVADLGQFVEALDGAEGLIHLAAIASPDRVPPAATFHHNAVTTFNAFHAARLVGLRRVVWSSSEMVAGTPFPERPPARLPLDETQRPCPQFTYGLSKQVGETIGGYFHENHGIASAALRFTWIARPPWMRYLADRGGENDRGAFNLWGYVDARDAASACRLALEATHDGAEAFFVAADDAASSRPSAELAAERFPGVELRPLPHPYASLISSDKAKRVLGYAPRHSWRNLPAPAEPREKNPR